jgi:hypothetical protein
MCVIGWNCLPLAQALSIEVAAISVIGCFATTRERALVSRSYAHTEGLSVQPQGLNAVTLTSESGSRQ